MEVGQIFATILYGTLIGVIYGVATVGLNVIFGVLRIVNVGHGAFIMVGAYTTLVLYGSLGVPPPITIAASILLGAVLGLITYYLVIKHLVDAPELATLIATFAIGILLQETVKAIYGSDTRGFSWNLGFAEVLNVNIVYSRLAAALLGLLLLIALYALIYRTKLGLAMRAVVQDKEGAMVVGINVDRIYALSYTLGIMITVASGSVLAIYLQSGIHPYMGEIYTLKGFVIAVMGGLGSIIGAFVAGVLFGLFENASYLILSQIEGIQPLVLTRSIAFLLLLTILLLKPTGLFRR
ncbi:MAG: branched-chain amino acid ABC transporter permease [Aeropyrum sp.]|nr:branched-chain amino acid ABC transporter permease [Aeropyrum sp.]MCE4615738.1 branched-chain amino acid ABC transporter permease [Aeropyrum sp.]